MEFIDSIRRRMRHNPIYRKKVINTMINIGMAIFVLVLSLFILL